MNGYRPTIATISLEAVRHNVHAIQKKVGNSMVMAVVKANGYGHGMLEVARASLEAGAQWLGIATVDEALALRKAGLSAPILILGPTFPDTAEICVANDISVSVGTVDFARAMGHAALKLRKKARVHIKVDTGMGRFGFWWKDLIPVLPELKKLRGIHLEGVFTHFAVSDIADPSYTRWQNANFRRFLEATARAKVRFDIIHAANSGVILQHPDTYYDMVRTGVLLYGMLPDPRTILSVPIEPVMTLTTKLVEIRCHPKGRFISYGRTWQTPRKSRIGILPIGYGDGLSRKYSNRGEVVILDCRAPIVGWICMDQTLVDVTHIPEAKVGDDVLLWGKMGENVLKVEEVAQWTETITYDVTCSLGPRVPRIYV